MKKSFLILVVLFSFFPVLAADIQHGWCGLQAPERIIYVEKPDSPAEMMLAESLSGLAAQAVNEGHSDTMVWIGTGKPAYCSLLCQTLDVLDISDISVMDVWTLASHLRKKGIVKGYILYELDKTREDPYIHYTDTDYSANTATVYAGLMQGALISTELVNKAHKAGLRCLKDAREESLQECFSVNKDRLNNHSALSIPPSVHHLRDYAIAHRFMLYDDRKDIIDEVLEWVEPMSPILGWGCGDEYDFTSVIAEWGHYNTASNWCMNLPLISTVNGHVDLKKIHETSPAEIDFSSGEAFHSFLMSDGDNIQWSLDAYLHGTDWMGAGLSEPAGLSWTTVPTTLAVLSPLTWNAFADYHASSPTTFVEYGGGYEYPDLFARKRPDRTALLRAFAKRINARNEMLGIKVFGFLCKDICSPEALEAFQIFAEEMPGLTGMIAVQYFPYELDGRVIWVKNKSGIEIPVMTARYSLWDDYNASRPRAGHPQYVSSLINRDANIDLQQSRKHFSWTIVHAWSFFDDLSHSADYTDRGYGPVLETVQLLQDKVRTIPVNELLWRVRMDHNPSQTRSLIETNNK